jgi:hypothetical protein
MHIHLRSIPFAAAAAVLLGTPINATAGAGEPISPQLAQGERDLPTEGSGRPAARSRTYTPRRRTYTPRTRRNRSGWSCYGAGRGRVCSRAGWICYVGRSRCLNRHTRRWHVLRNGRIGRAFTSGRRTRYTRRRSNCMRVSTRTTFRGCQAICQRFGPRKCRAYVRWNKYTSTCTYRQGRC